MKRGQSLISPLNLGSGSLGNFGVDLIDGFVEFVIVTLSPDNYLPKILIQHPISSKAPNTA